MKRIPFVAIAASLVSALALGGPVLAQEAYPNKPIRLITPAAQGGTTDILARVFGAKLSEAFKQQVLVDNRASASGVVAGEIVGQRAAGRLHAAARLPPAHGERGAQSEAALPPGQQLHADHAAHFGGADCWW